MNGVQLNPSLSTRHESSLVNEVLHFLRQLWLLLVPFHMLDAANHVLVTKVNRLNNPASVRREPGSISCNSDTCRPNSWRRRTSSSPQLALSRTTTNGRAVRLFLELRRFRFLFRACACILAFVFCSSFLPLPKSAQTLGRAFCSICYQIMLNGAKVSRKRIEDVGSNRSWGRVRRTSHALHH